MALRSILVLVLALFSSSAPAAAIETLPARPLPLCGDDRRINCIVDGDTLWLDGRKIRLEDIDAPEVERYACPAEKALGDRATLELQRLAGGQAITLELIGSRATDQYRRELRTLEVGGRSVGQVLVAEGLAHEWVGHKLPWC